jgi:hypothetical protein
MKRKLMSCLGVFLLLAEVASAEECFCLHHSAGAILRGCESYKAPDDSYPTALCRDAGTGAKTQQTMYSEWRRVEEGQDGCIVCRSIPRVTKEVPRAPP